MVLDVALDVGTVDVASEEEEGDAVAVDVAGTGDVIADETGI